MEPGGAGAPPLTAEEEAVKRNTDCVYFLASPLTCKKGNECEYRHSEGARLNPRDCWYWLNGHCLNPKCSFRHPPLDGLIEVPGTTLVPALPSHTVSTPQIPALLAPAAHNPNKQSVPCYFFQKGQCLKGDRCAFMHGPQSIGLQPSGTPVPPQVAKVFTFVAEPPQAVKKESWSLKECTQQNKPEARTEKPVAALPLFTKHVSRTESIPPNGLTRKRSLSPYPLENELTRSLPANVPVISGMAASMPNEGLQNGRDADEFLGESSPGFDVLVDDDIEDSDYLPTENDFGIESVQGGRSMYPVTDFNYPHSDYEPVANLERDHYNGKDEYDRYGRVHSQYGWEQQRTSSERIMDSRLMPEKRVMRREESGDEIDRSDLRHRLSKRRRLDHSRSAVSSDRRYVEGERYHGQHSHRDRRHFPPESSISTRLQGRIKLPVRSSPDRPVDLRVERERQRDSDRDRERYRGRLSPARPTNYPGRHQDRMKRRLHDDFATDARNFRSPPVRSDDDSVPLNFAGPKSLAELKGTKVAESSQEQSAKSIYSRLSVEPKSLKSGWQESEALLKRNIKIAPGNGPIFSNGIDDTHREYNHAYILDEPKVRAVEDEEQEEGLIPEAKDTVEMEEGMIMEAAEDREVENFEQRNDEESDLEAVEGGDVRAEDDENMYEDYEEELDDEEEEEEEEDDFARKVGVMLS